MTIHPKPELGSLGPGDVFHATSPNGASLICLVISIENSIILARTVTTQKNFQFDVYTGTAHYGEDLVPCTIDSVKPVPEDIYRVILEIDRKFRLEQDVDQLGLSNAEINTLTFLSTHYKYA